MSTDPWISKQFTYVHTNVLCVATVTSRSWMELWHHCWRRKGLGRVQFTVLGWDLCLECPFDSRRILFYFLNHFIFDILKGIKNGCSCIVEIRGPYGFALATSLHSPTACAGSPTKAQPCVPLISTMYGQPFLIPLLCIDRVQSKRYKQTNKK